MSRVAKQYDSQPVLCVSWRSLMLKTTSGFVLGNMFMPSNAAWFANKIGAAYSVALLPLSVCVVFFFSLYIYIYTVL